MYGAFEERDTEKCDVAPDRRGSINVQKGLRLISLMVTLGSPKIFTISPQKGLRLTLLMITFGSPKIFTVSPRWTSHGFTPPSANLSPPLLRCPSHSSRVHSTGTIPNPSRHHLRPTSSTFPRTAASRTSTRRPNRKNHGAPSLHPSPSPSNPPMRPPGRLPIPTHPSPPPATRTHSDLT